MLLSRHVLGAFGALALGACQPGAPTANPDNPKLLMRNDFEQSIGWGGAAKGSLTTAKAHGGQWAVLAAPGVDFSFTYERTLGQLGARLPRRLRVQGWALRANPASIAKLVVQVNASASDTATVFYGALPLAEAVREFDTWTAVSYPVELPATAAAGNVMKIYLWRDQATAPTYLDDVELISED